MASGAFGQALMKSSASKGGCALGAKPAASQRCGRTGLNSTSLAMPFWPMMEMAWSMPPDSVPTYFSQDAVNVASSCTDALPWAA